MQKSKEIMGNGRLLQIALERSDALTKWRFSFLYKSARQKQYDHFYSSMHSELS